MPEGDFVLSCPGKTFLLGEYYVTQKGEAWLLATEPKFSLRVQVCSESQSNPFHSDSPAGKLWQDNISILKNYHFEFHDPYQGLGGFGASTAQFLLLWQAISRLSVTSEADSRLRGNDSQRSYREPSTLLNNYLKYAYNNHGTPPSGADLLAQSHGGFCYVDRNNLQVNNIPWPFADIEFHIIHTRNKLATHAHLANLENLNTQELKTLFQKTHQAILKSDTKGFLQGISDYQSTLTQLNLTTKNTLALLNYFKSKIKILAAKGCGAMGADTIILFTEKNQVDKIKELCEAKGLTYIANNHHLATEKNFENCMVG